MADPTGASGPTRVETRDAVAEPIAGRDGQGGVLRSPRLAWAAAVLALLAAGVFGVQWRALAAEASTREEVRETAEVMAARVTTFDGATIDEFVTQLRELATGEYASQVTELFDAEFREALRDSEAQSVGEVTRSFVQQLDGDRAEVFVLVRQTSLNAARPEPVEDELRMELTLSREDGSWLVADVAVLGPEPAGPPAAVQDPGEGPP